MDSDKKKKINRRTFLKGAASTAIMGGAAAATAALKMADELGMHSFNRMAPAYAILARTDADPVAARAGVGRSVELARGVPGDLGLAYVLTLCGDTLLDLDDSQGEAFLEEARSLVDRCPDPGIVGRLLARVESRHNIAQATIQPVASLVEQLTERETAVLRYLPTRMSQREIASELFVSLNTVKTHCAAIYRKLAVAGRKAAVQAARELDLL